MIELNNIDGVMATLGDDLDITPRSLTEGASITATSRFVEVVVDTDLGVLGELCVAIPTDVWLKVADQLRQQFEDPTPPTLFEPAS